MPIELFILGVVIFLFLFLLFYTFKTGISPIPSSSGARSVILGAVPPDCKGVIYELGSGWGSLAFPLAKRFPANQVIAIELSPIPWIFSKVRYWLNPLSNLEIVRENFHQVPLGMAAVVICYLYPGGMVELKKKLVNEVLPGTCIISNTFCFKNWKPLSVHSAAGHDLEPSNIYVYQSPPCGSGDCPPLSDNAVISHHSFF